MRLWGENKPGRRLENGGAKRDDGERDGKAEQTVTAGLAEGSGCECNGKGYSGGFCV